MWYQYAKRQTERQKPLTQTETVAPRLTDGEARHDNIRPNTPPDSDQHKDGMNRPANVRHGEGQEAEAA